MMNKIKEYIELIKSSGYWENIFTPDDWSYILDVVQKSNFGTFLEHIDMSAVLENIKLAEEFSLYFQEDNSNIYFKGISNNFKCFTTSPTDLHFALQAQIAVYQRNLKYWPEAWEDIVTHKLKLLQK